MADRDELEKKYDPLFGYEAGSGDFAELWKKIDDYVESQRKDALLSLEKRLDEIISQYKLPEAGYEMNLDPLSLSGRIKGLKIAKGEVEKIIKRSAE